MPPWPGHDEAVIVDGAVGVLCGLGARGQRSVTWFGQPLVSYQVAQASRLSTISSAHSGERADAQPASA